MIEDVDDLDPSPAVALTKRSRVSAMVISVLAVFGIIPRWVLASRSDPRGFPR